MSSPSLSSSHRRIEILCGHLNTQTMTTQSNNPITTDFCSSSSSSSSAPFSISSYLSSSRLPSSFPTLPLLCPAPITPPHAHVTVITGASSGIGRATAIRFALQGAKVALVDLNSEGLAETVKFIGLAVENSKIQKLIDIHKKFTFIKTFPKVDVADADAMDKVFSSVFSEWGVISSAFINAGVVGHMGDFHSLKSADFAKTLSVNVIGAFNGMKSAAQHMMKNPKNHSTGGSIVVTSSVAGLNHGAGGVDYSASKSAVNSMVKSMANELRGQNIRVNSINPGIVETGMTKVLFDMARQKGTDGKIGQLNPLERRGFTGEVAAVVCFLCSSDSSYVNGIMVPIDGGLTSSMPTATQKAVGKQIAENNEKSKKDKKPFVAKSKKELD